MAKRPDDFTRLHHLDHLHHLNRLSRKLIGAMAQASLDFGHWLETPVPMLMKLHHASRPGSTKNLYVFLPGIQDQHLDFELSGFIHAARDRDIDADLLVVDAHVGYYARETILDRLRKDVILPARRKGYKNIWLVGTSLGGLGSALYARKFGDEINGVFMMAPFLGGRRLLKEMEFAGGPPRWDPSASRVPGFQIELWRWLKSCIEAPGRHPPLFLGFGDKDRFAKANNILANELDKEKVLVVPGGHDWRTWAKLWTLFLDQLRSGV